MNMIILPNIFYELMANALQEEGKKKEKERKFGAKLKIRCRSIACLFLFNLLRVDYEHGIFFFHYLCDHDIFNSSGSCAKGSMSLLCLVLLQ